MKRETVLKGLLTKEWNTGKYKNKEEFEKFFYDVFIKKHQINTFEFVAIQSYISIVCLRPPTNKVKRDKKDHSSWQVYFYFLNEDINSLVYIGKTYDVETRLKKHIYDNRKFKQVKYILCCGFLNEQDALTFEAYYTRYLQPPWNITNKEAPSQLYKLPTQKIYGWCERYPENLDETLDKLLFENNVLVPKFQKVIDYISL